MKKVTLIKSLKDLAAQKAEALCDKSRPYYQTFVQGMEKKIVDNKIHATVFCNLRFLFPSRLTGRFTPRSRRTAILSMSRLTENTGSISPTRTRFVFTRPSRRPVAWTTSSSILWTSFPCAEGCPFLEREGMAHSTILSRPSRDIKQRCATLS